MIKEVFSDILFLYRDLEPEKKPKLKNVTPKEPVQLIDHWLNDGREEPDDC